MPAPKLTLQLRSDYRRMFDFAQIRPEHAKAV